MTEDKNHEIQDDIWSPIWDVPAVAKALEASTELYNDVVAGAGYKLRLGVPAELQLFPDNHITCLRHPNFTINLSQVTQVEACEDKVVIESADANTRVQAVFRASGELIFNVYDAGKLKAMEEEAAGKVISDELTEEQPREEAKPKEEKKEKEQPIQLTGRVGREPEVRRTSKDKVVLKIPLAVQEPGQEKATWHNVLFFGDKAEQAATKLNKGDLIKVIGFPHTREVTTRTGIKKQVTEIYAAGYGYPKQEKK